MERIVITGCGIVSPIGTDLNAFSESIHTRRPGISQATFSSDADSPSKAGEITDARPERFFETHSLGRLGKTTLFSIVAGRLGIEEAGLAFDEQTSFEAGLIMGSHHGEFKGQIWSHRKVYAGKPTLVSPNRFLYVVPNTIAGEVCARLRIRGYNSFLYDAETSSALSVVLAFERLSREGSEQYFLAGGSDAIDEDLYKWRRAAGSLATDEGTGEVSRPFDTRRNGLVMGEGSGMVVLERLDHALARNAWIHSEIAGCAVVSSPTKDTNGIGIAEAMAAAMKRAQIQPSDIGAIIANANSTEEDRFEAAGIRKAFDGKAANVPVTSLKSYTGECFGASGAMSLIAGTVALKTGLIFPVLNFQSSDCGINVPREQAQLEKPSIIINSISRTHLRTTNVSIVLKGYI